MTNLTSIIRSKAYVKNDVITPLFYRLYKDSDRRNFTDLLQKTPNIEVFDEIEGQLEELFKLRNPSKKFSKEEVQTGIRALIGARSMEDFGVWVYYPWNNSVVHILDEEEFIESRTNRNMYKITPKEREILAGKKVGVIGLSVGSSVAFILALERICGELRLVDYDSLELSNLNRIDASVQDLGLAKTTKVARKIAELDPFLNVVTWKEGAHLDNLDEIITKDGQVDLLIDECDSLNIKVALRDKAKEFGVPVLMSTSDSGVLDVERFDLEPNRSVFHGFLDHLDLNLIEGLTTNESKIPYILPILQPETMSSRLKASMVEVGQSLSTWPQLGSDVYAGAGVLVGVARELLIGNKIGSGRHMVDWKNVIYKDDIRDVDKQEKEDSGGYLNGEKAALVIRKLGLPEMSNGVSLDNSTIRAIVRAGTLAPSGGNCQPWFWYAKGTNLFLLHDTNRSKSLLDFEKRGSFLAFGAATENIQLEASKNGLQSKVRWLTNETGGQVIAVFSFSASSSGSVPDSLANGIEMRQTNRNISKRVEIDPAILSSFQTESIHIVSDEVQIRKIGALTASCERIRLMHETGHRDFVKEMRWTPEEATFSGDGIDLETVDLSPSQLAGLEVARDPRTIQELNALGEGFGVKFEDLTHSIFESASSLALITSSNDKLENYSASGRVMQRFWLECNLKNISIHPVSAPLFLYYRSLGENNSFTEYQKEILKEYFDLVVDLFGLSQQKPIFLMKMSIAEGAKQSVRRSIESVFAQEVLLTTKRYDLGS